MAYFTGQFVVNTIKLMNSQHSFLNSRKNDIDLIVRVFYVTVHGQLRMLTLVFF